MFCYKNNTYNVLVQNDYNYKTKKYGISHTVNRSIQFFLLISILLTISVNYQTLMIYHLITLLCQLQVKVYRNFRTLL